MMEFTTFDLPDESSRPRRFVIDSDDRNWYVETGVRPNKFVGFDPSTENFFSITEVDSGGGSVRHTFCDHDENVIWFGTDANTIGRATLPPLKRRAATQ